MEGSYMQPLEFYYQLQAFQLLPTRSNPNSQGLYQKYSICTKKNLHGVRGGIGH